MTRHSFLAGLLSLSVFSACSGPSENRATFDPAQSKLKVGQKQRAVADGVDSIQVTFTAIDTKGMPLPGVVIKVDGIDDPNKPSFTPPTDNEGVTRAQLTSTRPKTATVRASLDDIPFDQKPTIEFVAGPVAELLFTVPPKTTEAGTKIAPAVQVSLFDAQGHPRVDDDSTEISMTLVGNASEPTLLGETKAVAHGGVATFENLQVDTAGTDYVLVARAKNGAMGKSPKFEVTAAAANEMAFVNAPANAVAGVAFPVVWIELLDVHGNRDLAATSPVTITLGGSDNPPALSGTTTVTPTRGLATFSDLIVPLAGHPYTLVASAPDFPDIESEPFGVWAGSLDSTRSQLTSDITEAVADGADPVTFTLVAKDAFGNLVPNAPVQMKSDNDADTFEIVAGVTDENGVFSTVLTSTKSGSRNIRAVSGYASKLATVTFKPGPSDETKTTFVQKEARVVANGITKMSLVVSLRDANGNPIEGEAVTVSLDSTDAADTLENSTGHTNASGEFTATLKSTKSGTKALTALVASITKPLAVDFVAGPPAIAKSSFVVEEDFIEPNGTEPMNLVVTLRDAHDNPVEAYPVTVKLFGPRNDHDHLEDASENNAVSGPSDAFGVYVARMTSTKQGKKTLTAEAGPFVRSLTVSFGGGKPDAGQSLVWVKEGTQRANGTDEAMVYALVRDALGTPMVGASVEFSASGTGHEFTQPLPTNSQGVTSGTMKSLVSGDTTVQVRASGIRLEDVEVTFDFSIFVGGTVSGLAGIGLVLENNGVERLSVSKDGLFAFATTPEPGAPYDVTVSEEPPGQSCVVSNGSGIIAEGVPANDIEITCASLRGTVSSSFAASHGFTLANDGSLWGWGSNSAGQLGDGTLTDRVSPVQILAGAMFDAVATGASHTLALDSDGGLWGWGDNTFGQLGDGTTVDNILPTQIMGGATFKAVAAGAHHSLAIDTDGKLWAWGRNEHGQLGDESTVERWKPTPIAPTTRWTSIAGGRNHTLGIQEDGSLWVWGDNTFGQVDDRSPQNQDSPIQILIAQKFSTIAAGAHHSLAIDADGNLWAWGQNDRGQLGLGEAPNGLPARVQPGATFRSVSAGAAHSLAIDATGGLWAWGGNDDGQFGSGPSRNEPVPLAQGKTFNSVAAGGFHSLAVENDGTLRGWGDNAQGQLGNGRSVKTSSE